MDILRVKSTDDADEQNLIKAGEILAGMFDGVSVTVTSVGWVLYKCFDAPMLLETLIGEGVVDPTQHDYETDEVK